MQIHVIASSHRNSKEICTEAQANLPAHTLVIQTHAHTQRQMHMYKYISANSGMWENRHKPKYSDICEYAGIQTCRSRNKNIKIKYKSPETCKYTLGHFH